MSISISARQISDVISVVCDAVYKLAIEDDSAGAIRRLEEAAGGLHLEITNRESEGDGLSHVLRAVKTLAHALEALADDRMDLVEMHVRSAVDALSAAVHRLKSSYGEFAPVRGNAVQFSVSEALRIPNEDAIRDALRDLALRSEPEAFLIFLDADTGNFVQVTGSKSKPLVLEIPLSSLSDEEIARAEEFFDDAGYADARGEESFSATLDQGADGGASLAMDIFSNVLHSREDFSLKIEEN